MDVTDIRVGLDSIRNDVIASAVFCVHAEKPVLPADIDTLSRHRQKLLAWQALRRQAGFSCMFPIAKSVCSSVTAALCVSATAQAVLRISPPFMGTNHWSPLPPGLLAGPAILNGGPLSDCVNTSAGVLPVCPVTKMRI